MSIQAIRLRNFRGFKDVTLPLKPLTILLGPNSSGKSSFGHALAVAAHCQKLYRGSQRPSLTPDGDSDKWPIDLGMLSDLRTRGESGRVHIGITTESGTMEFGFGGVGDSESDKNNLALSYLSHPFKTDFSGVVHLDSAGDVSSVPPPGLSRVNQGTWWDEVMKQQATVDLDGLFMRSVLHLSGRTSIPPAGAQERVRALLSTLTYLRATRRRPSRRYDDTTGQYQPIGYGGEYAPALLQEKCNQQITFFHPPPIPASLEEAKKNLDPKWPDWKGTVTEGLSVWLRQLQLAEAATSVRSGLDKGPIQMRVNLSSQELRDITEVGFGLSQVLPVLCAGLMQPQESLFVVDLPEAHLHPWPQARLADFFCSLALSGRLALVETHSEMFFHRLRLWVALNNNLIDKIAVYFIDEPQHGECSQPREIGLASGEQIKWPIGFLGEAWDTEKRISLIREARSTKK